MSFSQDLPPTFGAALKQAQKILANHRRLVAEGLIGPESEILVSAAYRRATGRELSRLDLFTRVSEPYPAEAGERLIVMASQRAEDKPLQHITGSQQFLSHEYAVSPATLIPRPETEFLVTFAIDQLRSQERASRRPIECGLEVGLGTGVISIELLHSFPNIRMRASELVPQARELARANAEKILGSFTEHRLTILATEGAREVLEPFGLMGEPSDFLISNPPYVARGDAVSSDVLLHEPATALFGPEEDSVYFYRRIAEGARALLKPEGRVFVEVPHERAELIRDLFSEQRWRCSLAADLTGRNRVLHGSYENSRR